MISTTIHVCGHEIKITQTRGTPSKKWGAMRYKHVISLKTLGHPLQKFNFWSSINQIKTGKNYLNTTDLKEAFNAFISDAIAGDMDIDDFSAEFGYTKVSECTRIYKECQISRHKLVLLGIEGDELYDISNALED